MQTAERTHLRPEELGHRWATSTKTLSNWRHVKRGPAYVRIGGSVRYPIAAVEAYEAANLTATTA